MPIPHAIIVFAAFSLSACSLDGHTASVSRGFDLTLSHPSPFATYMRVTPGAGSTALPTPAQINTVSFSNFLAAQTGCGVNTAYPITTLGSPRAPVGYVVPITCP